LWVVVRSRRRPRRFALHLPVKYRADGERRWHDGLTVNLSAGGAVIVGDAPASGADGIVVMIPLPAASGCLIGRGRIVRTASTPARPERCSFAIAVPHYRLEHQPAALTRLDTLLQGC
jgi:hypothetical protein